MDYKISVIIPAYNGEKFLAETLDCVLNQTLRSVQIVIVDDGSTDSTPDIIADYAKKHSNILAIRQPNSGVSAARNNGIRNASGEYLLFLDTDDVFTPDSFELMCDKLDKTGADIAICRVQRFGYGGEEFNPIVDEFTKEDSIGCYDKRLLWNFLVSNKCYRTKWLMETGVEFPALRYSEDGAFFMQAVYHFPKITGVYGAVFRYRRHTPEEGSSVTQRISSQLVGDFCKSLDIVYEAAKLSFEKDGCTCTDKDGYLQEILAKAYTALINEFYRLIWAADDETCALMKARYEYLTSLMTAETLRKCSLNHKDIKALVFDKKEINEKPQITVVAKHPTKDFLQSLYAQSMPVFQFLTCAGVVRENLTIISASNFENQVKAATKGQTVISLSGKKPIDPRLLKVVSLLKASPKFGIFPDSVIVFGAKLFLKLFR
ncbi:MAG: glycosyltransferase family 2 protein [Clostridia bacterium]|nr:glycosyltransferase family 2 protein [Clostridia bacterium]